MAIILNISSGFRRYIGNTIWLALEKFLSVAAALFVSIWIARHLGPNNFGLLMFAQSVVALFASVSALGLNRILERDLVSQKSGASQLINTSLALTILGATLAYLMIWLLTVLRQYEQTTTTLILIVGLNSFLQVNTIFSAYFYSQIQGKQLAIATICALFIGNALKVSFILLDLPVIYFAIAMLLDGIFLLPLLLFITRKTDARLRLSSVSVNRAKVLLNTSWPYILIIFLTTVYLKVDLIMLKELMTDYHVGQYAAAAKLSEGLYYVPAIILTSIYPALVNAKKRDLGEYNDRLANLFSLLFYLAIAASISVSIIGEYLITILYGSEYSEAIPVLAIHVWSSVFVFIGICCSRWLLTENLQKLSAVNALLGCLLNIALNYYLIPRYGIAGAAWATLISYCFSGYLCFLLWKRTRPLFYLVSKSIFKFPKFDW